MIELGRIVVTKGAHNALEESGMPLKTVLRWHQYEEEEDPDDPTLTEPECLQGEKQIGLYPSGGGVNLLLTTEADRSKTTVMTWDEYQGH